MFGASCWWPGSAHYRHTPLAQDMGTDYTRKTSALCEYLSAGLKRHG
ncbi:MAG: hypothetical protein U1E15_12715 [Hyphomicrobiales bacterium]